MSLPIESFREDPDLSPAKLRFNALVKQIARVRDVVTAWQDHLPSFRHAHAEAFRPVATALDAGDRAWAFALDAALAHPGWTRSQQETLRGLICEVAGEMLWRHDRDLDLKALFDRHSPVDFDTGRRRLEEADAKARETREALPKRRDVPAELAAGSVRDIYRKLASALHPDRETDTAQRDAKTALMQQVNQAYDRQDLLALLDLQLQFEQIDADHIAAADEQRVVHYNHVLSEQLRDLLAEAEHLAWDFCDEFDLDPASEPDPAAPGLVLADLQRSWDVALYKQKDRLRLLADDAAMKRWLNGERRRPRRDPFRPF